MPLDKDSQKVLDSIKLTGKPARFVLVQQGSTINNMEIFRKGTAEAKKTSVKKGANGEKYTGNVETGVLSGQGLNIVFQFAKADGYDAVPCQAKKLKEYLKANIEGNEKYDPEVVLVDQLAQVDENDADQPGRPGPSVSSPPPTVEQTYWTQDQWVKALVDIKAAPDDVTRLTLLNAALTRCNLEMEQLGTSPLLQTDPGRAKAIYTLLKNIQTKLTQAHEGSSPPPSPRPDSQPNPQAPNPVVGQQQPNRPVRPAPPVRNAALMQKATQRTTDRSAILADAKARVDRVCDVKNAFKLDDLNQMMTDAETDDSSDFGKILPLLPFDVTQSVWDGSMHAQILENYTLAKKLANEYIANHKDPRVGSLPKRVKKRRSLAQQLITDITQVLDDIQTRNEGVVAMCKSYREMLMKQGFVAPEVVKELTRLRGNALLSNETKEMIAMTIDLVKTELPKKGYEELARANPNSLLDRVEIMEAFGCYNIAAGGTSGVKLLKDQAGKIEFAVKEASQDSKAALDFLNLPPGACAIREDISSEFCSKLEELTGIKLGFPKSEVATINGKTVAVIEGISGKMVDPEEFSFIRDKVSQFPSRINRAKQRGLPQTEIEALQKEFADLQAKLLEMQQNTNDLPDQVSKKSLENVLLSTVFTCQWDCKWGNMIIEGTEARPIDGGTAIPTKDCVNNFINNWRGAFPPSIDSLVKYPEGHAQFGQFLPQAKQPMDPQTVAAILNLNVDDLIQAGKDRRDATIRSNPDLQVDPPLMEDSCFDIVRASIQGAQAILRKNPQITLEQFSGEYAQWFMTWGTQFCGQPEQ
ncbi:MAG: hypothetical protein U1A77_17290 [Pirellulales bacterium]